MDETQAWHRRTLHKGFLKETMGFKQGNDEEIPKLRMPPFDRRVEGDVKVAREGQLGSKRHRGP